MLAVSQLAAAAAVMMAVVPWTVSAAGVKAAAELEAQVDVSDGMWKERPLAKVVALLKDMQMELEGESQQDEALYDQTACWCSTNEKQKTKAIEDGKQRIDDLEATITELTSKTAALDVEIKTLTEDIAEKTDGLDKARKIREKESAEFNAEERDLVGSITALKGAIITLSKHNPDAVLVQDTVRHAARVIQRQAQRSGQQNLLESILNPDQQEMFTSLIQRPGTRHVRRHVRASEFVSLLQDPYGLFTQQAIGDASEPASGQIYGVLKQMHETFVANLAGSQKTEAQAQETFASLKTAKESELAAAKKMLEAKSSDLASSNEENAQAKADYEDTKDGLAADTEFLTNLKQKCSAADHEWEVRRKTRHDEITAVGETIELLTNDDSRDLMSKTLGFVQVASRTRAASRRASARRLVTQVQMRDAEAAATAEAVRLDTFVVVKKSLDKLSENLKKEQVDETKQRDFCTQSLFENSQETAAKNDRKMDLTTKIDDMKASIHTLNEEILALKAEITDMQVELQRASAARTEENNEFQQTVMDQRATQDILRKAIARLKEFYDKKLLLVQRQQWQETLRGGVAPPADLGEYQKSDAASGVIQLLDNIRRDSKETEEQALAAENDAHTAYMSFVKDTNVAIEAKAGSITDKLETRARLDATLTTTGGDLKHTLEDLGVLASYAKQLHQACDFLLQNFELRQASRAEEVEALSQAEGIFAGADYR